MFAGRAKLGLQSLRRTTLCYKSKQCTTQNLRQDRDKLLTRAPTRHRTTPKPRFNLGAQLVATFILGVVGRHEMVATFILGVVGRHDMVATFILGVVGRHDVGSGAVNYYGCAAGAPVWLQRPPYDIFKPQPRLDQTGKRVYKINFASLFAAPYRMLQT